jgi:prepilin signal peptidase PulO-like enzyme (type II secretory pathway)
LGGGILSLSVFGGALVVLLAALAHADLNRLILPDRLNALLAATGLAHSLVFDVPPPLDAGMGALFGAALFAAVGFGFRRLRGYDGLGLGDVKFAGAAGFWIGWQGIPVMVLSASLLALAFVIAVGLGPSGFDLRAPLPFGPFLCAGTLVAWLIMVTAA